ncbi:hypothetical protein E4U58_001460 [Claviceps cyperi]|nr:hypothetical protein E4U58_001460 [Claviceps cyperi]
MAEALSVEVLFCTNRRRDAMRRRRERQDILAFNSRGPGRALEYSQIRDSQYRTEPTIHEERGRHGQA